MATHKLATYAIQKGNDLVSGEVAIHQFFEQLLRKPSQGVKACEGSFWVKGATAIAFFLRFELGILIKPS